MRRSKETLERRNLKKKWKVIQQKEFKNDLENEKAENAALNLELNKHKNCKMKNLFLVTITRNNNLIKSPQLLEYNDQVNINDQVLGKGSFGIVRLGFFKLCCKKSKKHHQAEYL